MAEDYPRFAADMAKASMEASLDALRRQVYELNRRVDQIESRLAPAGRDPVPTGTYCPSNVI